MNEIRILRPIPFLCRVGIHFRDWSSTTKRVDIMPQSQFQHQWFGNTGPMEGKLHVSTGKCKRCADLLRYYTVYDVEESL